MKIDCGITTIYVGGRDCRCVAFSLIEIIGVLAVLTIGATLILYTTTQTIDVTISKQESATMQSFANALQSSIVRNRYVPGAVDWYQTIATEMGVSTNAVLYTTRNQARAFLIDPSLLIGTNGLPYTQGTNGASQLVSSRVMLVSSAAPSAPLPAAAIAQTNFSALWNTADGSVPANGTFNGWKGTGDDLKIQRLNLAPLFVELQLFSFPVGTNILGQCNIDGVGPVTVPSTTNGLSAYFFQTTLVDLLTDTNSGGTTNGRIILDSDISLYYVSGYWRNVQSAPIAGVGISGTQNQTNSDAQNLGMMISVAAASFAASPLNTNAPGGADPVLAINTMSNFMSAYVAYANWAQTSGLGFVTSGPYYQSAHTNQANLNTVLGNLESGIVQGGCP